MLWFANNQKITDTLRILAKPLNSRYVDVFPNILVLQKPVVSCHWINYLNSGFNCMYALPIYRLQGI
jgi:hypothetical protein